MEEDLSIEVFLFPLRTSISDLIQVFLDIRRTVECNRPHLREDGRTQALRRSSHAAGTCHAHGRQALLESCHLLRHLMWTALFGPQNSTLTRVASSRVPREQLAPYSIGHWAGWIRTPWNSSIGPQAALRYTNVHSAATSSSESVGHTIGRIWDSCMLLRVSREHSARYIHSLQIDSA